MVLYSKIAAHGHFVGYILCGDRTDGHPCICTDTDTVGYDRSNPDPNIIAQQGVSATATSSSQQAVLARVRPVSHMALGIYLCVLADHRLLPGENANGDGDILKNLHAIF